MKHLTFFLFSTFLFTSCIKESIDSKEVDTSKIQISYDTVKIGEYFPVYPNSYWIYKNQNGDTVIHRTSLQYHLFSNYHPVNSPYDTIKYYATLYDSMKVDYYSIYIGSHSYHESGWKRILPDSIELNMLFQENYIWANTYNSGKIETIDTSITIQTKLYNSVIIVQEYTDPSLGALNCGRTFYAKDIGIIKKELRDINTDSITFEELLDYNINR